MFHFANWPDFKILKKKNREGGVIKRTIIIHTFSYDDITLNLFHI